MTIITKKFSEFIDGGDLTSSKNAIGLSGGENALFNVLQQFLPAGDTANRPSPSPDMYYRLRLNTLTEQYEWYSPTLSDWVVVESSADILPLLASHLSGRGASLIGLQDQGAITGKTVQDLADATLITQTNNGSIANGQTLSVLDNGFVSVTTATGVLSSREMQGTINQIEITNTDGSGDPTWSFSSTLDIPGTFTIQSTTALDAILDEDDMVSNSDTAGVTQQSVKAYVDNSIGSAAGGINGEIQYNNAGGFGGDSGFTTNGSGSIDIVGDLDVDNLNLNSNVISSTDVNGDVVLSPNGSGALDLNSDTVVIRQDLQHKGDSDNKITFTTDAQNMQTGGGSRLDINNAGVRLGGANSRVTTILDENNMASNSATALATQQSIKAYVDALNINVVQYVLSTSTVTDSTSVSGIYQNSSLSATIKPTSTANKILIYCFAPNNVRQVSGSNARRVTALRIYNVTTAVSICEGFCGRALSFSSGASAFDTNLTTIMGEETAPSTGAITYQLQFYTGNPGSISTIVPTISGPALMLIIELLV